MTPEEKACRDAGFTNDALKYLRCPLGMRAICAFNNIDPGQAPLGWRYYPNAATKAAWERVIKAIGGDEA